MPRTPSTSEKKIKDLEHEIYLLKQKLQIAELSAEIERKKREKAEAERSSGPWRQIYGGPTWTTTNSNPVRLHEVKTEPGSVKDLMRKVDEMYQRLNYKGKHRA